MALPLRCFRRAASSAPSVRPRAHAAHDRMPCATCALLISMCSATAAACRTARLLKSCYRGVCQRHDSPDACLQRMHRAPFSPWCLHTAIRAESTLQLLYAMLGRATCLCATVCNLILSVRVYTVRGTGCRALTRPLRLRRTNNTSESWQ